MTHDWLEDDPVGYKGSDGTFRWPGDPLYEGGGVVVRAQEEFKASFGPPPDPPLTDTNVWRDGGALRTTAEFHGPSFTVDRYGGTYSFTRGPEPRWRFALRGLRWAFVGIFTSDPGPRPRRFVPEAAIASRVAEKQAEWELLWGGLFAHDEAKVWAIGRERELRRVAMREAAMRGDIAPGVR